MWSRHLISYVNCSKACWRHQMETFSALLAICAGSSPVPGEFPAQRPVTRSFDVFFDLRPNKRLGKQWWGWWFETPLTPFWRHCNGMGYFICIRENEMPRKPILFAWTVYSTSQEICTLFTLCYVLLWLWIGQFYAYLSGSLHRQWGNITIASMLVKQPWRIWDKKPHHYADLSESIELLKCLSGIWCRVCV